MTAPLGKKASPAGRFEAAVPVLCLLLISIAMIVYVVAACVVRPAMYSDSGWGFLGWDSREAASSFNHSVGMDDADISRDAQRFMSHWSPGQHVVPGLFETAGMDLGLAIVLSGGLFSVLGLLGWYVLYRSFGFPLATTMISLAIIACGRFFNLPFTIYNGGELLLFGVAPWFIAMVWKLRALRWYTPLPFLAGAVVLAFMKLTGIVVAAAAVGSAAICGDDAWRRRDTLRKLLMALSTIAAMAAVFHVLWLAQGPTPATAGGLPQAHGLAFMLVFAIGAAWSAALSLGDLGAYIFLSPSRPILASADAISYALLLPAVVVFAVMIVRLRDGYGEYLRFTFFFTAAMAAFLILNWTLGRAIGFDERHLRIPSLLVLAGAVHAFLGAPWRLGRGLFALVVGVSMAYGVASFAKRTLHNLQEPLGIRGVRLDATPQQVLDFLRQIDSPGPEAKRVLVFLPSPEIALEVRHARKWSNHADFQTLADLRSKIYRGRVDRLYVIMQKRLIEEGKADAILRSFVDYPIADWIMVPLGDFVCFYQTKS